MRYIKKYKLREMIGDNIEEAIKNTKEEIKKMGIPKDMKITMNTYELIIRFIDKEKKKYDRTILDIADMVKDISDKINERYEEELTYTRVYKEEYGYRVVYDYGQYEYYNNSKYNNMGVNYIIQCPVIIGEIIDIINKK